jgi:cell division protein FtsL
MAFTSIHIVRENTNRSKSLQLMSGTNSLTYWLSNYLFEFTLYLVNIASLFLVFHLCYFIIEDKKSDLNLLLSASQPGTIFSLAIFLAFLSFSCATFSYLWAHFFKSDILSFSIMLVILVVVLIIDAVLIVTIVTFQMKISNESQWSSSEDKDKENDRNILNRLKLMRTIITIVFPNLNAKRALYNLKLQNFKKCIEPLNSQLRGTFIEFL